MHGIRLVPAVLLFTGCGDRLLIPERSILVEAEPVAWTYDPAAPSSLVVEMEGGLTDEAERLALLQAMDATLRLTVATPAVLLLEDEPSPVRFSLTELETDVELSATCGDAACAWRGAFGFDRREDEAPIDVSVEVWAEIFGRFRSDEDARGAVTVSIEE